MSQESYDPVNRPEHYASQKIEPIDFIESAGLSYHLGNTVKYISRHGRKIASEKLQDLKKAQWYLNRAIKVLEEQEQSK